MVPKIHAKGSSFKGAAQYLLHDKDRASSSERVAWAETRNLAVDDPDMGWRIMAATAMDQDRLKAQAGVKNTGRKSDKHVLHISLAWHPEQEPSREEMTAAADQALKAIGAGDRQAMIIAHNDEPQAHVHLLINRVSPEDGRHLKSSNDRLKLSRWAEKYEREAGQIYCEDRVVNNAIRDRGEYVKGVRDIARHIFEAQGSTPAPANDNDRAQAIRAEQRAKDHALSLKGRNMAALHALAWDKLAEAHRERKAALSRQFERETSAVKSAVREEYRPRWRDMHRTQESERRTFEELERSFFGRASNMAQVVKVTAQDIGEDRTGIIGRSFAILTNAGKRKEYFEAAQERAQQVLQRDQRDTTDEALKPLQEAHTAKMAALREHYAQERQSLIDTQQAQQARLQEDWKARTAEREQAYKLAAEKSAQREAVKRDYTKAASPPSPDRWREDARTPPAAQARRDRIKEFLERSRAQEQDNAQDRGQDDDIDI